MQGEAPLLWALKSLPEDLWARSQLCPRDRVLMLSATSKRVRALLKLLPTAVRVRRCASVESVEKGLQRLMKESPWCSVVVRLDLERGWRTRSAPIGAEGAGRLAVVLGQCSSLAVLNLGYNGIDDDGIAILRACWPEVSGLDDQFDEDDQFF